MLKSGLALILLGIAQFLIPAPAGIDTWLCRWSGISWIAAGLAYVVGFSSIFGKRSTGNLQALHAILMAPYLVVTWILWFLQTRLSREPVCNEVAPGVWVGARCSPKSLPPNLALVVDMTCEIPEDPAIVRRYPYRCVSTLDTAVPNPTAFREIVELVTVQDGPVYIHCALGHGRSATVAVAVLIARKHAATIDEAIAVVKAVRPGIKVNALQRQALETWVSSSLS